jgi:hypothetical protein
LYPLASVEKSVNLCLIFIVKIAAGLENADPDLFPNAPDPDCKYQPAYRQPALQFANLMPTLY